MTRPLHHAAFAVGLLAIAWVGAGYIPGNPLALALVLLIGAFFGMGALELHRYGQATAGLAQLLAETDEAPADLAPWLDRVHPSLRPLVRLRVEGARVALPGPALAPALAGLLVLLGMLGTFLGMVVTLKGTGLALEQATDVEAIRASLAAPVKGLGLAFGTSVAGVAASAMLGLMSALARRERQRTAQQLDACIAGPLRGHGQLHRQAQQQDETLRLLRAQNELMSGVVSGVVPAVVSQLQGLVAQIERQGQALHERQLASQAQFQADAQRAYTGLAASVDRSLQASLAESARVAGDAIAPAVQATLAGLARDTAALREALTAAVHQQLDGVTARLDGSTSALLDGVASRMDRSTAQWATTWRDAAERQRAEHAQLTAHTREALSATVAGFEQHAAALLRGVADAHAALDAGAAVREQARMAAFHDGLATMAAQAEAHARATVTEVARLVQAAAEAPRAAAEVIGELRRALSDSLVRDNAMLDERNRLLGTLGGLLDAVHHASTEQRGAIDALVQATSGLLERTGARFADRVEAGTRTLHDVAAQVAGSAAEVASLGEGFGIAVQLFSQASTQLTTQLQGIESALGQSMARSDEQLAYYVAQAREIVDLTLGSQKQIVEDLQQLAKAPARAPAEADAA